MKSKIGFFLCITVLITSNLLSQICNCDKFPVPKECKKKCGIEFLQTGTKEQLIDNLKLNQETAQKIISLPNRKSKTKVEGFKPVLTTRNYQDLKNKFDSYIISVNEKVITQNTNNGDIIGRDKIINNYGQEIKSSRSNREEQLTLSKFMNRGEVLLSRCMTDTLNSTLEIDYHQWNKEVINYLNSMDEIYASQFLRFTGDIGIPAGIYTNRVGLYQTINSRNQNLNKFIDQLR